MNVPLVVSDQPAAHRRRRVAAYSSHILATSSAVGSTSSMLPTPWPALQMSRQAFFSMLPPELRQLWTRLAEGQTMTEISRGAGVPRTTLYERLERLRAVAERAGLRSLLESE